MGWAAGDRIDIDHHDRALIVRTAASIEIVYPLRRSLIPACVHGWCSGASVLRYSTTAILALRRTSRRAASAPIAGSKPWLDQLLEQECGVTLAVA